MIDFHAHPCPGPYKAQSDFFWSISIPTSAPALNFVSCPSLTSVAGQFSYLLLPFFAFILCPAPTWLWLENVHRCRLRPNKIFTFPALTCFIFCFAPIPNQAVHLWKIGSLFSPYLKAWISLNQMHVAASIPIPWREAINKKHRHRQNVTSHHIRQ